MGAGLGITFLPTSGVIAHYFTKNRSLAMVRAFLNNSPLAIAHEFMIIGHLHNWCPFRSIRFFK